MNSIQVFAENGIRRLYEIQNKFVENPTDFYGLTKGLEEELTKLGQGIIRDVLELMDEKLRESPERKAGYDIERRTDGRS